MKKLVFDIAYDEKENIAKAAAVEFTNFSDDIADNIYTYISPIQSEYIPGQFYKRELPAIVALIENEIGWDKLKNEYDLIMVDGLYQLGPDHPGLGAKLKEYLMNEHNIDIEVVGVAKTYFHDCEKVAELVNRGKKAIKPLYVNGSNAHKSYDSMIKNMHGNNRLPTLIKLVDSICRSGAI